MQLHRLSRAKKLSTNILMHEDGPFTSEAHMHVSRETTLNAKAFPHLRAVCYVFSGTVVFALVFASSKLTGGAVGLGPIMFLRYLGSILALVAYVYLRGQWPIALQSRRWRLHLLRTLCSVGGVGAVIYASARMPVLDATAISMLHVIGSVALARIILGEPLTARVLAGASLSTAGGAIVMISGGAFSSEGSDVLIPALAALASAFLFAFDGFLLKISTRTDSPLVTLAHMNVFAFGLTLIPCLLSWSDVSVGSFSLLVALGPLALVGQYLVVKGYMIAPLSVVAPIDHSLLAASCLVGLVLFGEIPGLGAVLGSATIAAGALLVAAAKAKNPRRSPTGESPGNGGTGSS